MSKDYSRSNFYVQQIGTSLPTLLTWLNDIGMSKLQIQKTLKEIMDADRHTLSSISKATGVPKSTISEWLNNRSPNPVQAVKVAKYLGVSLHFLLFGEEDAEEPLIKLFKEDIFSGTFEVNIKRVGFKEQQ